MDMIKNDKTTAVEDRLSSLPDDIIHHILGFLDLKYAVQTSALSWKWKNLWTFMPRLNLSSHMFDGMKQFSKFVEHALSHRDSCAEVSAVDLTFSASPTHFIIQDIVNYAYSCNVRQMTLEWSGGVGHELPEFFFSSHTLKYLTLDQGFCSSARSRLPKIDWDFPALETLNLTNIRLGDVNTKSLDLFSKCLHLKDLTLDNCSMYGLEVFNVSAPQLSNLIITKTTAFPTVFNVASTQLENLTASIISNGGMASCFRFLRLSAEGFVSLEKVNISLSNGSRCRKEIAVPPLLDLFQVLRNAKLVILDVNIIECLSSCLDQLSNEPCPFNNLKCLKINAMHLTDRIPTIPTQVRNYFLDNSPNAIFVMDLPQVLNNTKQTKSMTEEKQKVKISVVQAASNVKAFNPNQRGGLKIEDQAASGIFEKQKAKIQMNRQFIGKLKALLRAQNLQRVKLVSHIMKCKMVEFKAQVESGNPDYKVIHSIVHEIRDLIPTSLRVNLEAHFSSQYEKVKTLLHTCIDASQWAKIETILGNFRLFERFHSNNNHSQSAGRSVEHCQAARPSTAEVPNYTLAKKVAQEKQKGVTSGYWQAIAKQDVELHMQDQVIGKLKAKVRARKFQHGKLVLLMIKYKMAELVVQVESGNPDYEVIRSIGRDIKDFIPGSSGVNLEAQFSSQYNEVKSRLFTRIDASQWALIEKELGNLRHFEKLPSNSSHIQAALHATELPPAPKPYPDIVLQKRSREEVPNDTMANKVAKLEAGKKQPEPMPQDQEIRMLKEKIRMQDQLIAKQNASLQVQFQVTEQQKVRIQMQDQIIGELKAKLGAHDMQHEQLISQFIKCKVGELKLQVESGNPDYRVIHSIGCDIKGLIPGSLGVNVEAFFSSQYEEVKSLLGTCIDASQWAKISTELGSLRFSQRFHLNKRQSQHAMMTSSGLGCTGSNMEGSCK